MSASALNDLNARRTAIGRFGNKQFSEAGIIISDLSTDQEFTNVLSSQGIDVRDVVTVRPGNLSETRRKVSSVRGPAGGRCSLVELDDNNSIPRRGHVLPPLDVSGPSDGRPVIVHADAGLSFLQIKSGKAVIRADKLWSSNRVDVEAGAEAVIFATQGAKVEVAAREGAKVTVVCSNPENGINVWSARGEVTELYGPEAVSAPVCEKCGEAMEYATCRDCYCSCGKPADDNGIDPNLCPACNKETQEAEAAEKASDQARAWAVIEQQRAKNEAWSSAMSTARAHGIPTEVRRELADLVVELAEVSSWRVLDAAGDWARSRDYETGYLDYGPDLDSIHCPGAIFIDKDGDWQLGVNGVGRRNSAIDSEGGIDQMDYEGDEDGKIYPMQYILPWKKEQA